MSGKTARRTRRQTLSEEQRILRENAAKVKEMAERDLMAHWGEVEKTIIRNVGLAWLLALRDLYGFGGVRMNRAMLKVNEIMLDVEAGHLTFDDIDKALMAEVRR